MFDNISFVKFENTSHVGILRSFIRTYDNPFREHELQERDGFKGKCTTQQGVGNYNINLIKLVGTILPCCAKQGHW